MRIFLIQPCTLLIESHSKQRYAAGLEEAVTAGDWPAFMYDPKSVITGDALSGFCRGYLLLRVQLHSTLHGRFDSFQIQVIKHIFTGPMSTLASKLIPSQKPPNSVIHKMERVTGRHVAYAAVMVS